MTNAKVLVLNSYDSDNVWENAIMAGFLDTLGKYRNIDLEPEILYLDLRRNQSDEYKNHVLEMLNSTYEHGEFEIVITIDDHAFDLVRSQLFNENSIFYRQQMLFSGVNSSLHLSADEKQYMTGFMDAYGMPYFIEKVLAMHTEDISKNIILVFDETEYSNDTRSDLFNRQYLFSEDTTFHVIQSEYYQDIVEQIGKIEDEGIIFVVGYYKDRETDEYIAATDFINYIYDVKKFPIYAEGEQYRNSEVVGVYYDDGYAIGEIMIKLALDVIIDHNVADRVIHQELVDVYEIYYDKIYKHDINISNLPAEAIIAGQMPYQWLVPRQQKIGAGVLVACIFIICLQMYSVVRKYRKKIYEEKIRNDNLEEMSELQKNFFSLMTHEFRTPINIINSSMQLLELELKEDSVDKESCGKKIDMIYRNINRQNKLINNILDITKFDAGIFVAKMSGQNIVEVVEEVALSVVPFADTKGIEILFDTEDEEIWTVIDVEQVERMVLNIMSNAIKFSRAGDEINVYLTVINEEINITIRDNGIGMAEEDLSRIFEKFFQTGDLWRRGHEGSGLGLFIVSKIVELHKGKIEVESKLGDGTIFNIILPIVEPIGLPDDVSFRKDMGQIVSIEMSDV
ncbi:MAG: hypothetical protein ATN35_11610 [Epulopiscium sp. Nele67-Bin004]|nr:MAG: hypothetical protein ATN35_11610 [Epulopiscium sp. Nele67-Bin004]